PGGNQALDPEEAEVGDGGQRHRQHGADDERGAEIADQALEDQLTQPTLADQGGDGDEPDGGDGGDANAGHDHGHGQGKLDPNQLAQLGVAHALGRLPDVGGDPVEGGHDVADQDQQRVADEGHLGRGPGEAGPGYEQGEQGQRGDGVDDSGQGQDRRLQPAPPA